MNFGTKFSLLKQRVIGGGDQEPEELKVVRRKVQSFIPDLKKVRKAFNTWLEGAKALGNASEQMSSALQGSDVELQNIADTVAKELKFDSKHNDYAGAASLCTSAILSINKKIKLLDALKAKGDELENWRLQKNRLKRKMQEYEKKGDAEGVRKLDSELQTARSNYSSLYNELMAKYGYLIQMSDGKDGIGIVQTELIAFKHSQLLFFKNCAKTCQQYEVTTISSLEDEWLKFEMKLEQKVIERGQKANLRHQSSSAQVNDSGMITSENNAVIAGGVRASTEHLPTVNEDSPGANLEVLKERPVPPPPAPNKPGGSVVVRALYDYAPQSPDELTLTYDDLITVVEKNEDGWWLGNNQTSGQSGLFPGNYCELVGENEGEGSSADDGTC